MSDYNQDKLTDEVVAAFAKARDPRLREIMAALVRHVHDMNQQVQRATAEYFASANAFADPTHRRWFTYTTFEHFCRPPAHGWRANRHTWFGGPRFSLRCRRLRFGRAHRLAGVQWLANRYPAVYESLFASWFPARALEVELVKE